MPHLDTYRKQAKLLVRWHREGNYSIGGRIRQLPRYRTLTDREALALDFRLGEAQEIIALEAGYDSWADLKAAAATGPAAKTTQPAAPAAHPRHARPVLFVANVQTSAEFYRERLGFTIDFLHGNPPFYGAVSRGGATLHLKFVHEPVFATGAASREGLIMAFIEVESVRTLYSEFETAGVDIVQRLTKQAWGGTDFKVRDPDGNAIAFVG